MIVEDPAASAYLKTNYLDEEWTGGPNGGGAVDNALINPPKHIC
jgi:hypothetical protein